jgi:shikimate kinase
MGVGKTTVGQLLSHKLNIPFLDIDQQIERTNHTSIPNLFSTIGVNGFRTLESEELFRTPKENVVIATGGGIIEKKENRDFMKENGTLIYLHHSSFKKLYNRIKEDKNRPLSFSKPAQDVENLYHSRIPFYKEGSILIDTNEKSAQEVTEEIMKFVTN